MKLKAAHCMFTGFGMEIKLQHMFVFVPSPPRDLLCIRRLRYHSMQSSLSCWSLTRPTVIYDSQLTQRHFVLHAKSNRIVCFFFRGDVMDLKWRRLKVSSSFAGLKQSPEAINNAVTGTSSMCQSIKLMGESRWCNRYSLFYMCVRILCTTEHVSA